ncbi:MAG: type II secretion system F family protein [Thermoplasmatota archaeon]
MSPISRPAEQPTLEGTHLRKPQTTLAPQDRLFRYRQTHKGRAKRAALVLAAVAATVSFVGALWLFTGHVLPFWHIPNDRWVDLTCIGILFAVGPYGFMANARIQRRRALEERFPDFLRDLATSKRSGLTLTTAVAVAARGEYGALTPEIRRMGDQLSWNVPFSEALNDFAKRVDTPLVWRAVSLVNEASRAGGQVSDVLMAAARDAREINTLENERRSTMVMYTVIMYLAFLVFLGVVGALYATFIPQLILSSHSVSSAHAGVGGLQVSALTLSDYRTFYFIAAAASAFGNGLVTGVIETGYAVAGLRHSFVMVIITLIFFALIV